MTTVVDKEGQFLLSSLVFVGLSHHLPNLGVVIIKVIVCGVLSPYDGLKVATLVETFHAGDVLLGLLDVCIVRVSFPDILVLGVSDDPSYQFSRLEVSIVLDLILVEYRLFTFPCFYLTASL